MALHGSAARPIEIDDEQDRPRYRESLKKDLESAFDGFDQQRSTPLIRNALSLWLRHREEGIHSSEEPAHLCDLFRHHYGEVGEEGFHEEMLEGDDSEIVDCLKMLTRELPFEIYLASMTMDEYGELGYHYSQPPDPYDDGDDDDDDKSWHTFDSKNDPISITTYTHIFTVDGDKKVLKNDKAFYDNLYESLIPSGICNIWEDVEPERWETDLKATWREPPGSRTRMDPPTAHHWSRTAMLILVPRDEVHAFLLGKVTKDEAARLVPKYIRDDYSSVKDRASALKTLRFLARTLWSMTFSHAPDPKPTHTELGPQLIYVALKYLDYGLFKTVLNLLSSGLDPSHVFHQVRMAASRPDFEFKRISYSLLEHLRLVKISAGCHALVSIVSLSADLAPEMRHWITGTVTPVYLERCRAGPVGSLDGTELVRLIQAYHDTDCFKQAFAPILVLRAQFSPFILAAMYQFTHPTPQQNRESHSSHLDIWTPLAEAAIASIDMPALLGSPENHLLHARHLNDLLTHCTAPSLGSLLLQLEHHASRANSSISRTFWIPLLQEILPAQPTQLRLARAILSFYLTHTVGPAPRPTDAANHRRPAVHCEDRCSDCHKLNAFLESGAVRNAVFVPKAKNREHFVKDALNGCRECTVVKTNKTSAGGGYSVTKNVKGYEARKAAWEERVRGARVVMGLEGVREVLGDESYARTVQGWGRVGL
ncbi:hypothetical protein QBC39DRAFT_384454 [Podospora conica]|nr:hypothetical protein QBC39DRAFT_384454 [Schizothecium conicum]